ncbi:P-loop containing nucleoside triphosphate hydrolase protein [Staphylotrichum tortipilum]|uniref:P-loop containing nucleoside triphosphate hydrolase protein n=1 Tax=Staphylotrichum tortipilum TaxID=2831512 RepID=A0AAN6MDR9_9PEZI|nr:P-loop containing nucleoside triphosphate hydrolase protein [Staphylotrichum longicolle]
MKAKANSVNPDTPSAMDIIEKHVFFTPKGGNGWQSKPEFPTPSEILAEQPNIEELPENPVDAPWASKDKYLAAQYKILRCEAVEGLRYSVRSFADHRRKDSMMDDDFTNIYTHVRIKEYVMSSLGPLARVSFSTERSKYRIQWQQSKRLQAGNVVALSPRTDNFKKICKIATVAQRPYHDGLDQDPPLVDLVWATPQDAVLDPSLDMVMIESLHGYFESARHALIGLQHAAIASSSLDKYLIGADTRDNHPQFLKDDPIMDLGTLANRATPDDDDAVAELRSHDIVSGPVPSLKELTLLDDSQLLGLHRIVSKELAIVQGPPGTGKTFTSVEAIKAMVVNRRRHRAPPIIVAAQTNHALDQLLTHCINSGANVLRMGGRTQNELIKSRTLFELRPKCPVAADNKCRSIDNQRRANTRNIMDLTESLFSDRLLDPNALLEFGIITEAQHKSLCDDSMETHTAMEDHGPFALWLGDSLIPAKMREDRHPTQLEQSEAEARKNLPEFECDDDEELENIGFDDDDLFRIRGTRVPLKHVWSGKDPANLTSWHRAVKRALGKDDLFAIDRDHRGAVYQHFQTRLLEAMAPKFASLLAENVELCKKRKALKFLGVTQLVERMKIDIVGCTTTGLSKYRGCLAGMQPLTVLIEEAAETREANIVSALYPSVQQLILVGDHKQLAPKCDIQRLGYEPYNLNVSLFQRMVNLGMPFVMLKQQRRMKPELRSILKPFYPDLFDHPSVESINNRPDVPGMGGRNCWLFDHTWPEDINSDFSKFNDQEADMVVHFFAYLVANGTPADKITILTFYKGQRKVLLGKLKRNRSLMGSAFNVCTVDSYQGEENDIVLLSLVRSPQLDRAFAVGFLEDERRAVVAISRARRGFYVFGNVDNVLGAHQASFDLWYKICSEFATQGKIDRGHGLPIVCQPHTRLTWIKEVHDWDVHSGGCDQPCKQTRHCGHTCALNCHAIAHEDLPCGEPCCEKLVCSHGCQKLCGEKCYCDCEVFGEITSQGQASKGQHMSLEEQMLQMGAEPTEMLKASMKHRNAARQQARAEPSPQAKQQGQASTSQRGRKGKAGQGQPLRQPLSAPSAQMAAQWGQFVHNVGEHDKQLQLLLQPSTNPDLFIKEVYQPTSLVNGYRTGGQGKVVQQVSLLSAQAIVAAEPNAPPVLIPDLLSNVADLSLDVGPRVNGQKALSPIPQNVPGFGTVSSKADAGEVRTVNGSTQQQLVPRQPTVSQTNGNVNGVPLIDTVGVQPPLLGYETMPSLAIQSGMPIRPPPGIPLPMSMPQPGFVPNGQQQPRLPPGLPIPLSVPGYVVDLEGLEPQRQQQQEEHQTQSGTDADNSDGGQEQEEWLIEL